jgi:hypothetical protein
LIGQKIENEWENVENRNVLLSNFRKCLYLLESHKEKEIRELSSLADKLKNIHNANLDQFLCIQFKSTLICFLKDGLSCFVSSLDFRENYHYNLVNS